MSEIRTEIRRAALISSGIVAALIAGAMILTALSSEGSLGREFGLALLSGGVIGGALVIVESLLSSAAEKQGRHESLLTLLSSTGDLNGIDLSNRDLQGLYLPGRSLVAAKLEAANMAEAKLYFADLRHADLSGIRAQGVDLSGATLAGADLSNADLRNAILVDVDLSKANLAGALLEGAFIDGCRMVDATLAGSRLNSATISGTHLMGTDLRDSRGLKKCRLEHVQYDEMTTWPDNYDPPASEIVHHEAIAEMDLASYLALRASRKTQ